MTTVTIVFTGGASRALELASAKLGTSAEDFIRRAACDSACAELLDSDAESEPEIAEMFLRDARPA